MLRSVVYLPAYRPNSAAYGTATRSLWAWQDDALCARAPEADRVQFTLPPHPSRAAHLAEMYCKKCPVRSECYGAASRDPYFIGVAGGLAFHATGPGTRTRTA